MNKTEIKSNIFIRLMAFIITLALVLVAVAAVAYRDKINLDALKRWYTYRTLSRSDSGQAELFSYEGRSNDLFSDLDGDLLVCSDSAVRIYSTGGVAYLNETLTLQKPALASGGGKIAVYDAGGQQLRVFDERCEVFALTLDGENSILSASLSGGGLLTVTSRENGYKGIVTVYDSSYHAIMSLRLSSQFVMDAVLTSDGKTLAVLAAGLNSGAFESSLLFYHLDNGDTPFATCSMGNNIVLSLDSDESGVWALGDSCLFTFSREGTQLGQYDYNGRCLKNASLDSNGFASLLLGKYRSGSTADLVTVDSKGREYSSVPLSEQVLSFSSGGRYTAVLSADRLDIYTKDLTLYDTLENTQGARSAVMRSDGTVILIGSETARLHIPG